MAPNPPPPNILAEVLLTGALNELPAVPNAAGVVFVLDPKIFVDVGALVSKTLVGGLLG